jgi:HD-like signal output (HDOD) protein
MPPVEFVVTRENILEHARTLPAAPQVMAGLCELLQDINTDLDQISAAIRVDPALAARVIRISNSPVFGGGARVGSVDEAVNRVGFSEVLRLVGAATVSGVVDRSLACYGIAADRLRESLLLHALASEALASQTDVDPRTAYSAGLLRAIGMMVLDRVARTRLARTDYYEASGLKTYREWETTRLGVTGTDAATTILDEWRFPPEVVAAIQNHLLLRDAHADERLACVLNLAGAVVAEAGLALAGEASLWTLTPEKLEAAGLDEDAFHSASEQARTLFEHQRAALT